jgi:hypothetical protein
MLGRIDTLAVGDAVVFWSNFFLRSFTLVPPGLGKAGLSLLFMGAETDRRLVRTPFRAEAGTTGCFGIVPLAFERNAELSRTRDVDAAMNPSSSGFGLARGLCSTPR